MLNLYFVVVVKRVGQVRHPSGLTLCYNGELEWETNSSFGRIHGTGTVLSDQIPKNLS